MLFFASARDATGVDSASVELPSASTTDDLVRLLLQRHPALLRIASTAVLSVNLRYVDAATQLVDGDEVAVIPPVSGG